MCATNGSVSSLASRVAALGRDCPWTASQTPHSVLSFLREEVTETEDALSMGDSAAIASELGDLLFNVLLAIEVCSRESCGAI